MSDKEIVLLFKKSCGMTDKEWHRFCSRYATRNISTIIEYIKELCSNVDFKITNRFKKYLQSEMIQCLAQEKSL